jgi:hypothetical protein
MSKPCPLTGCLAGMQSWALMCSTHWSMVPRPLQEAVNHFNRSSKGGPSHRAACRKAIEAVRAQVAARDTAKPVHDRLPYAD